MLQLLYTPIGLKVAWRHNGDHDPRVAELVHNRLIEHVVAAQFEVPPDAWLLADQLRHAGIKHLVEVGNPAFILLGQRLIVDMCVADKNVVQGVFSGARLWLGRFM